MHARPAVKLTKLAKKFQAQISIRASDAAEWINAKSVAKSHGAAGGTRQHHRDQGVRRGRRSRRGGIGRSRCHRFSGYRSVNMRANIAGLAYRGRTASIGFAHGPFVRFDAAQTAGVAAGTPKDEEACASRRAHLAAGRQIAALASAAGGEAAQILEFQVALLDDEDFLDPIFAAIAGARRRMWPGRPRSTSRSRITIPRPTSIFRRGRPIWRICAIASCERCAAAKAKPSKFRAGAVICADDLPPSQFLEIDWSRGGGLALLRGSPTSHVAMLARARGIPMVVQLGSVSQSAKTALLDGEGATLELDPTSEQVGLFERRRELHRKNRASRARHSAPAGGVMGRREDTAPDQYPARRGPRARGCAICRRHRLMRTEFSARRTGGIAGRGNAIPGLRRGSSLGRQTSGDDPDLRRGRRQAGHRDLPRTARPTRSSAFAVCAFAWRGLMSLPFSCGRWPRRRARKSQSHVSHGHNPGRTGGGPQVIC
jgi:phosphohistidine swiveling domain-containing protein